MLRVSTYVAPSRIAGVGLFAAERIPGGTPIWEFTEGVDWELTAESLGLFPEPYRSWIRHYVYQDERGVYVLCGDNAKFMNHSSRPNCSDTDPRFTIASRTIDTGEELTCDYREFDLEARQGGLPYLSASAERDEDSAR